MSLHWSLQYCAMVRKHSELGHGIREPVDWSCPQLLAHIRDAECAASNAFCAQISILQTQRCTQLTPAYFGLLAQSNHIRMKKTAKQAESHIDALSFLQSILLSSSSPSPIYQVFIIIGCFSPFGLPKAMYTLLWAGHGHDTTNEWTQYAFKFDFSRFNSYGFQPFLTLFIPPI